MGLTTEIHAETRVLRPTTPRIDSSTVTEFRDAAREQMASGDVWLLDLEHVNFMDSSGVGAVVGLLKWMGRDRRLELCGLTPAVRNVFKLTRLDTVFRIHTDMSRGLAAHAGARRHERSRG